MLARVLEAFQQRMAAALEGSAAGALAAGAPLARLMAAEPPAPLAGGAVAFFVGRPSDSTDAFVADIVNSGAASFLFSTNDVLCFLCCDFKLAHHTLLLTMLRNKQPLW